MPTLTTFFQFVVHILDGLHHECAQVLYINSLVFIFVNLELLLPIPG